MPEQALDYVTSAGREEKKELRSERRSRISIVVNNLAGGLVLIAISLGVACVSNPGSERGHCGQPPSTQDATRSDERRRMVDLQIRDRGIKDQRVLVAMDAVPRHKFVPAHLQEDAYADTPLPIGSDQTISQPFIVAYMTEALQLPSDAAVLEVGTGSGYQAAVLAEVAAQVYSIEIVPELAERSRRLLNDLGYDNIHLRLDDGYRGWPEVAPFDGIIVTAAPDHVPPALVDQFAIGARLVIPVGQFIQEIRVVTRTANGSVSETTIPVRFVPMTGEAQR